MTKHFARFIFCLSSALGIMSIVEGLAKEQPSMLVLTVISIFIMMAFWDEL